MVGFGEFGAILDLSILINVLPYRLMPVRLLKNPIVGTSQEHQPGLLRHQVRSILPAVALQGCSAQDNPNLSVGGTIHKAQVFLTNKANAI